MIIRPVHQQSSVANDNPLSSLHWACSIVLLYFVWSLYSSLYFDANRHDVCWWKLVLARATRHPPQSSTRSFLPHSKCSDEASCLPVLSLYIFDLDACRQPINSSYTLPSLHLSSHLCFLSFISLSALHARSWISLLKCIREPTFTVVLSLL